MTLIKVILIIDIVYSLVNVNKTNNIDENVPIKYKAEINLLNLKKKSKLMLDSITTREKVEEMIKKQNAIIDEDDCITIQFLKHRDIF